MALHSYAPRIETYSKPSSKFIFARKRLAQLPPSHAMPHLHNKPKYICIDETAVNSSLSPHPLSFPSSIVSLLDREHSGQTCRLTLCKDGEEEEEITTTTTTIYYYALESLQEIQ